MVVVAEKTFHAKNVVVTVCLCGWRRCWCRSSSLVHG